MRTAQAVESAVPRTSAYALFLQHCSIDPWPIERSVPVFRVQLRKDRRQQFRRQHCCWRQGHCLRGRYRFRNFLLEFGKQEHLCKLSV